MPIMQSLEKVMTAKAFVEARVLKAFETAPDKDSRFRRNPFTGGSYVAGEDPEDQQIALAVAVVEIALAFKKLEIPGAPDFPSSYAAREALKGLGPYPHMVALWARSLAANKYRAHDHPTFEDYVAGVLAHPELSAMLQRIYPGFPHHVVPAPLPGLDASGYCNI